MPSIVFPRKLEKLQDLQDKMKNYLCYVMILFTSDKTAFAFSWLAEFLKHQDWLQLAEILLSPTGPVKSQPKKLWNLPVDRGGF